MKGTLRFFRILLQISLVLFLLTGIGIYLTFISAPVQRSMVQRANSLLFNHLGSSLEMERVSIGLFPPSIQITNAAVVRESTSQICEKRSCSSRLSFGNLTAEFDLSASYASLKPVINSLELSNGTLRLDWDDSGRLVFPVRLPDSGSERDSNLSPMTIYRSIRGFLPIESRLKNIQISLADSEARSVTKEMLVAARLTLQEAVFLRAPNEILDSLNVTIAPAIASLQTDSQGDPSRPLTNREIERLSLSGLLGEDASFQLRKLAIEAPWIKLDAKGKLLVRDTIAETGMQIKTSGFCNLESALALVEVPATGQVNFDLNIRKVKPSSDPSISGDITWPSGTFIDGYSLHKGRANLTIAREKIAVKSLELEVGTKGKLQASGDLVIDSEVVRMKARGAAHSVSFLDLLHGLDVDTNAFEFSLNSDALDVNLSVGVKKRSFGLNIEGPLSIQNLKVPSLHTATRSALPDCRGQLRLFADFDHLDLGSTKLHCRNDNSDEVITKKGTVDFNTGEVLFDLEGTNVDLANAEYFLMDNPSFFKTSPTIGSMDFKGELRSESSSSPITFKSEVNARDVRLYGVDYRELRGTWGLDSSRVWGNSLRGKIGKSSASRINLDAFEVRLDNQVNSLFEGTIEGELSDLFDALKTILPEKTEFPNGHINQARVRVSGPFSPRREKGAKAFQNQPLRAYLSNDSLNMLGSILTWNSAIQLDIVDPIWHNTKASRLRVTLNCKDGECFDSRVVAEAVSGDQKEQRSSRSGLLLNIAKFSLRSADLAGRFQNLPIGSYLPTDFGGRPLINGRCEMQGSWDSIRAYAETTVEGLTVSERRIEPIQIALSTNRNLPVELKFAAQSNQIQGRFLIPKQRGASTTGYLNLKDAELTALIPRQLAADHNARINVSGELQLKGKITDETVSNANSPSSRLPWYHGWTAGGKLTKADIALRQIAMGLSNPAEFQLTGDTVSLQGLRLQNTNERGDILMLLGLTGSYNLATEMVRADASLNIDLTALPLLSNQFGSSRGALSANVNLSGKAPNISVTGDGKIAGGTILVQSLPPAFRDVDLSFAFNDKSIEVIKLKAKKGEGTLEANGVLDWQMIAQKSDSLPALDFNFNLNRFQSRIPIPAVQAVDVELDGRLQICRRHRCEGRSTAVATGNSASDPVLISGSLIAQDARVSRGVDCVTVLDALLDSGDSVEETNRSDLSEKIALDLEFQAPQSLAIDTKCARTRMSVDKLTLSGPISNPRIIGKIETSDSTGSGQLGNIRFNIENGSLEFDGRADNPRYDILLSSTVSGYRVDSQRIDYKIYIHLDDRPQNRRRKQPEIRAEPPTHPDGTRPLSQTDLVAMLLTGRGPDASSPVGFSTEFVANEFATLGTNAIFSETRLQNSVSRMFNRLSSGIVDRVAIDPIFEAGRPKFRIRTIMEPVENVNVNMETDQDPSGTEGKARNAALTSQWILNSGINLGLDLRVRDVPVGTNPFSMGGGISFQFGGE